VVKHSRQSLWSVASLRYSLATLLLSLVAWAWLLQATASNSDAGGSPMLLTFFALFLAPVTVISFSWMTLTCLLSSRQLLSQWAEYSLSERLLWGIGVLIVLASLLTLLLI